MRVISSQTALLFAVIGSACSIFFQDMFYWGGHSFFWFYVGAGLSYLFSVAAILTMVVSSRKRGIQGTDIFFNLISSILVGGSLLWTTFIIIAWQSGF